MSRSFESTIYTSVWFSDFALSASCTGYFIVLCWFIWIERNKFVFEIEFPSYFIVLSRTSSLWSDWTASKSMYPRSSVGTFDPPSVLHSAEGATFFCDGAFDRSSAVQL